MGCRLSVEAAGTSKIGKCFHTGTWVSHCRGRCEREGYD
jgi:hypothetical protein